MFYSMLLRPTLLSCLVLLLRGDKFHCDQDQYYSDPLPSYLYTCDGVQQCVDGTDELGCVECESGRLLLSGLPSHLAHFNTIYEQQSYKLWNRPVYKAAEWSIGVRGAAISYNATSLTWQLSEHVERPAIAETSAVTYATRPFNNHHTWSLLKGGDQVPVRLQCAPREMRKCSGNLLVSTPNKVYQVEPTMTHWNERPVYHGVEDAMVLRFSNHSNHLNEYYWQLVNETSGEEVVSFPGSQDVVYPELILSPGVTEGRRGSNIHIKCEVLSNSAHPLECIFEKDLCSWNGHSTDRLFLTNGVPTLTSLGDQLAPAAYISSSLSSAGGTLRLSSAYFTSLDPSCLVLDLASTVYVSDYENTNFTVHLRTLYSTDKVYSLETCTGESGDCVELVREKVKIDLPAGEEMQVYIDWTFGRNDQYSGTMALFESAFVSSPCSEVDTDQFYTCDMEWPCDWHACTPSGMRGYECQCEQGSTGDRCGNYTSQCDVRVQEELLARDHVESVEVMAGYWGEELRMTCQPGYTLHGDTRCPVAVGNISCLPTECPALMPPSNVTIITPLNSTHVQTSCAEGYLPSEPELHTCEGGTWTPGILDHHHCTLDCSFINTTVLASRTMTNVGVRVCERGRSAHSYTDCLEVSQSVLVGEALAVRPDIVIRPELARLCVRYGEEGGCVERCVDDIYLRVNQGENTVIEILRDVYDRDNLISAAPSPKLSFMVVASSAVVALISILVRR